MALQNLDKNSFTEAQQIVENISMKKSKFIEKIEKLPVKSIFVNILMN